MGADTAAEQVTGNGDLGDRGAAAAQGNGGNGRSLQRSGSSGRRLLRSGSSGRMQRGPQRMGEGPTLEQRSEHAAKPAAPSHPRREVAPGKQPAGSLTAPDEAHEHPRSGLELGIAAGMLALPEAALHAGAAPPAPLLRRRSSGRSKPASHESNQQEEPEQAGRMLDMGEAGGADAPHAAVEASRAGGASDGGAAEPDQAAAAAEAERRRAASFMELLRGNMARRQAQRAAGCGELGGPSLAAALAAGARQKKVRWRLANSSCSIVSLLHCLCTGAAQVHQDMWALQHAWQGETEGLQDLTEWYCDCQQQ